MTITEVIASILVALFVASIVIMVGGVLVLIWSPSTLLSKVILTSAISALILILPTMLAVDLS